MNDPLALTPINQALRTALCRSCDQMRRIRNIGDLFWEPVDIEALQIPDYFSVIRRPMDLLTLKQKLQLNCYDTFGDFIYESALIWQNCRDYNKNSPTNYFINSADEGERNFIQTVAKQAGAMLQGFSWKAYLRLLQGIQDNMIPVSQFVKIYEDNEIGVQNITDDFNSSMHQFNTRISMLDEQSIGELVDFYLRKKGQLVEMGAHEIDLKVDPDDLTLARQLNMLSGFKLQDHIKRGRGKRMM
ncbi:Bromodomain-containing protein [Spironucleus salmonicida]|uniref:Bromodomain-containing protein n=1 Tax=Spironucleus salmonicida TaxID=348837 RepID=V6LS61_9EUKA|nr:Bromodomain-containing protein [Spironucleus salmonicida]|eukprot:EST46531.1 Bromodomain-containing protein [Spironucleus salmonicida]